MNIRQTVHIPRRVLSLALCAAMVLTLLPLPARAEGICEHHPEHTADCGYQAAVEGQDCTHSHDDSCGYQEASPCTHSHDASCGYREARSCTHVHNDTCGYVEAVAGSPCTYQCEICAQQQNAQNLCTHGNESAACETCASEKKVTEVQALINALPETVTEETREAAQSALSAVEEAKAALTEAEQEKLDLTRCTALKALLAEPEAVDTGKVLTDWEWVDDFEIIDPKTGLAHLPFASAENIAYYDAVIEVLPAAITANEEELTLGDWLCEDYPMESGAYEGEYIFETTLPEGYVLEDGTNVLRLTVVLGDPEGELVGMMTITPAEPTKEGDVYQISSAAELYWFANEVNNNGNLNINAVLTKDITVNDNVLNANGEPNGGEFEPWTPIGKDRNYVYSGQFDGQGHTISGLYLNDISDWYVGLFGASGGTITNVKVADSYFNAMKCVGGVCGINGGTVSNCVNSGTVIAYSNVGGVCGENITYVSYGYQGTITGCYNTGTVKGTDSDASVGGVCGSNYTEGAAEKLSLITGCYNTGAVSGTNKGASVGGVCGYNRNSTITGCYSTGAVSGTGNVGGVCGGNYAYDFEFTEQSTVNNCYYNTDTYSGSAVGNNTGTVGDVLGKTTREFASGQVAYLLNGNSSSGIWKQNLDVDTPDAAPNFTGGTVYTTALTSTCKGYSNTDNCTRDHSYAGGICLWCGEDTNLYITVSGIEAEGKTYDGTTTATLNFDNVQLAGKVAGDDVSVTATGTFENKNAGENKTVNITGLTLTGKDASKYRLADSGQQTTATAKITPKGITVTITPGGGTYGGTITPATASLEGVLPGETDPAVILYYSGYANDRDFHSGQKLPAKAGTYTVEATNINSGNYTLTSTTTETFVINRATVTTPTVASKVYTGETLMADVPASERYTVSQNNGGTDVGSYDVVLTLTDAHNYQWDEKAGTPSFHITKADNVWTTNPAINGWTYGDTPSTPTGTAKFGTMTVEYKVIDAEDSTYTETQPKNAGTYTARFTVAETTNYGSLTKDVPFTIRPKPVTVSGITADGKTYDGKTTATLKYDGVTFTGKLGSDSLTVTGTGEFTDANVGENKTVTISGLTLGGDSKDNYTLSSTTATATATITKAASSVTEKPEDAKSLYSGVDVPLVTAGTAQGGTMMYRLGEDGSWTELLPQAAAHGEYTVYYYVKGDGNHEDTAQQSLKARIRPFEIAAQPQTESVNYGESKTLAVILNSKADDVSGITYQWCLVTVEDGREVYTPLEGETGSSLTLTKPNAGTYVYGCIITCGDYSETSGKATVTVTAVSQDLPTTDLPDDLWVEGGEKPLVGDSIDLKSPSSFLMTSYTYNGASADAHQNYPTGMQIYSVQKDDQGQTTVAPVAELGNLLRYSGCSIRITGKPGIRMITSLTKEAKAALKKGELAGYTLEEYGTVAVWSTDLDNQPLTLNTKKSRSNYAYKRGVSDPVFANVGALTQYTNVLVWDSLEAKKYDEDIVMRSYIKLSNQAGETVTLYGGTVSRSIGYVAQQNANTFSKGTAGYKYVHEIIDKVNALHSSTGTNTTTGGNG